MKRLSALFFIVALLITGTAFGQVPLDASQVQFTPNGSIAATNVQSAIQEVRDESLGTLTINGTANQITVSGSSPTFTLSIPNNPTLPGNTTGTFIGNLTGNVSGTAGSLAANPVDCAANRFATTIAANGDLGCGQVDVSTSAITGILPAANVATSVIDASASYCADAGASDTYACSLSPAPSGYVTGARYRFKANTANTGAATINFNSLGAKTIKKAAGGVTTDLSDNDIRVGQVVDLTYDGTNMQIQSTLGNASGGGGMAIGGAVTSGTTGSILFVGSGPVLSQNNTNFFWDDTNSRLGLGTATPGRRLHMIGGGGTAIVDDIGASPGAFDAQLYVGTITSGQKARIAFGSGGGGTAYVEGGPDGDEAHSFLAFRTRTSAGGTGEAGRFNSTGMFGVGLTGPTVRIQAQGTNDTNSAIRIDGSGGSVKTAMLSKDSAPLGAIGTVSNHILQILTNNTEAARINTSGNLMIGTTSQYGTAKVSISGGYVGLLYDTAASPGTFEASINIDTITSGRVARLGFFSGGGGGAIIEGGQETSSSNSYLAFRTRPSAGGTVEAFRIKADGTLQNKISGNESTGAGSALLGNNSPASTNTAPYTWLKVVTSDGSTGYVPIWK